MAVSSPKQRFSPRATLYSPPPSLTAKCRVVQVRYSPGSKRSITSPRLTTSQRQPSFGLTTGAIAPSPCQPAAIHGQHMPVNVIAGGRTQEYGGARDGAVLTPTPPGNSLQEQPPCHRIAAHPRRGVCRRLF